MDEQTKQEMQASLEKLKSTGELDEQTAQEVQAVIEGNDEVPLPATLKAKDGEEKEESEKDIRAQLSDMKLSQKIKLSMQGNATIRSLLITDTNRLVQEGVLKNPQMRESEVEDFAKNPNVSDFVLRYIAGNKGWMKSYMMKVNLVTNPKTPQDVSLKWLRYLRMADLRKIAKSKNLPQVIANTARKRVAEMQKKK